MLERPVELTADSLTTEELKYVETPQMWLGFTPAKEEATLKLSSVDFLKLAEQAKAIKSKERKKAFLRTKRRQILSSSFYRKDKGLPPVCLICANPDVRYVKDCGILVWLPHFPDFFAFHEFCLLMAPETFCTSSPTLLEKNMFKISLTSVHQAFKRVILSKYNPECSYCGFRGAFSGCWMKKCMSAYHLPCAMRLKCHISYTDNSVICPTHIERTREKQKEILNKIFPNGFIRKTDQRLMDEESCTFKCVFCKGRIHFKTKMPWLGHSVVTNCEDKAACYHYACMQDYVRGCEYDARCQVCHILNRVTKFHEQIAMQGIYVNDSDDDEEDEPSRANINTYSSDSVEFLSSCDEFLRCFDTHDAYYKRDEIILNGKFKRCRLGSVDKTLGDSGNSILNKSLELLAEDGTSSPQKTDETLTKIDSQDKLKDSERKTSEDNVEATNNSSKTEVYESPMKGRAPTMGVSNFIIRPQTPSMASNDSDSEYIDDDPISDPSYDSHGVGAEFMSEGDSVVIEEVEITSKDAESSQDDEIIVLPSVERAVPIEIVPVEEVIVPEASSDKRYLSPSSDKKDLSPSSDRRDLSPSSDRRDLSPPSDKRDLSPSSDKRDLSPSSDKRDLSSLSDKRDLPSPSDIRDLPSSSDIRDLPSSSDIRDLPSSSDIRDLPSSSDIRDLPSSSDKRDLPSSPDRRDLPSSPDKRDLPSSSDKRDLPSSSDKRDLPSSSDKRDLPSSSDKSDLLSSSDKRDLPSSSDKRDLPSSSDKRDLPSSSDKRDLPSSSDKRDLSPPPKKKVYEGESLPTEQEQTEDEPITEDITVDVKSSVGEEATEESCGDKSISHVEEESDGFGQEELPVREELANLTVANEEEVQSSVTIISSIITVEISEESIPVVPSGETVRASDVVASKASISDENMEVDFDDEQISPKEKIPKRRTYAARKADENCINERKAKPSPRKSLEWEKEKEKPAIHEPCKPPDSKPFDIKSVDLKQAVRIAPQTTDDTKTPNIFFNRIKYLILKCVDICTKDFRHAMSNAEKERLIRAYECTRGRCTKLMVLKGYTRCISTPVSVSMPRVKKAILTSEAVMNLYLRLFQIFARIEEHCKILKQFETTPEDFNDIDHALRLMEHSFQNFVNES